MAVEIDLILGALERYERWTGRQSKNKAQKEKEREDAIQSLLNAVTETGAYLSDRAKGAAINRKREMRISQLWSKAAINVRRLDKRLSKLLALKSMGWADPSLWDDPRYKKLPLKLDTIREQCLWLMENEE